MLSGSSLPDPPSCTTSGGFSTFFSEVQPINDNHTRVRSVRSTHAQLVFIGITHMQTCDHMDALVSQPNVSSPWLTFSLILFAAGGLMQVPAVKYLQYLSLLRPQKVPAHTVCSAGPGGLCFRHEEQSEKAAALLMTHVLKSGLRPSTAAFHGAGGNLFVLQETTCL